MGEKSQAHDKGGRGEGKRGGEEEWEWRGERREGGGVAPFQENKQEKLPFNLMSDVTVLLHCLLLGKVVTNASLIQWVGLQILWWAESPGLTIGRARGRGIATNAQQTSVLLWSESKPKTKVSRGNRVTAGAQLSSP